MFGKQAKALFFDDEVQAPINHCMFGRVPKQILQKKIELDILYLTHPEYYVLEKTYEQSQESMSSLAQLLSTQQEQLIITQTTGECINSIIRNLGLTSNDSILITSETYSNVQQTLNYYQQLFKFDIKTIKVSKNDLDSQSLINLYKSYIKDNKITLAIVDAISCDIGIRWPYEQIIQLCKENNIIVILDAAHGVGILNFDLNRLQPDFFVTNLHKWGFVPAPTSLLYFDKKYEQIIHTNTINEMYNQGIQNEASRGNVYCCVNQILVKHSIDFMNEYGYLNIIDHNKRIALEGAKIISKLWATEILTEDSQIAASIYYVQIPVRYETVAFKAQKQVSLNLLQYLSTSKIYMKLSNFEGAIYARVTGQIYNELSDYEIIGSEFLLQLQNIIQE